MKKVLLLFILLSTNLFAQSGQDQFNQQIEEIMKAREEMLKALMDGSMSGDFESRMEEIMKRFGAAGGLGSGFDAFDSPVVGEYDWLEDATHKTLKIKVTQVKDKPLEIKIQNNEIKIKGDVESTRGQGKNKIVERVRFEKTFSIPEGVDKTNPEFKNVKDGFMEIKFKKLSASQKTPAKKVIQERIPVAPDTSDLSI